MGACTSKPKVRGDDVTPRSRSPASSSRRKNVPSVPDPPAGQSPVAVKDPPSATHVEEEDEANSKADEKVDEKNSLESGNAQSEPSENSPPYLEFESMKPEPVQTEMAGTKLEVDTEMKLLESEMRLMECTTKADIGGLSNHTPKTQTPPKEQEPDLPEAKKTPEATKEEAQSESIVSGAGESKASESIAITPKAAMHNEMRDTNVDTRGSHSEHETKAAEASVQNKMSDSNTRESQTTDSQVETNAPTQNTYIHTRESQSKDSQLGTNVPVSMPETKGSQTKDMEPETRTPRMHQSRDSQLQTNALKSPMQNQTSNQQTNNSESETTAPMQDQMSQTRTPRGKGSESETKAPPMPKGPMQTQMLQSITPSNPHKPESQTKDSQLQITVPSTPRGSQNKDSEQETKAPPAPKPPMQNEILEPNAETIGSQNNDSAQETKAPPMQNEISETRGSQSNDSEQQPKSLPDPKPPMQEEILEINQETRGYQSKDSEQQTKTPPAPMQDQTPSVDPMPLLPDLDNALEQPNDKLHKPMEDDPKIENETNGEPKMEEQSISGDTETQANVTAEKDKESSVGNVNVEPIPVDHTVVHQK